MCFVSGVKMQIDLLHPSLDFLSILISRNVSKEAGHLTNCCTKKQVRITAHSFTIYEDVMWYFGCWF